MKSYLLDFVALCGLVGITYGASLVYVPLGFVVGGVLLVGIAFVSYDKD